MTVLLAGQVIVYVPAATLVMSSVPESPLSDAVARFGAPGADGAVVSMVTERPDDAEDTLPATSVWMAVNEYAPSGEIAAALMDVVEETAVALAVVVPSIFNATTALVSVPSMSKVGVVSLVMSSVEDVPESEPACRLGALGADGDVVSTVTARADEFEETLPAVSVAVAVNDAFESAMVDAVMLNAPADAVVVPTEVTPL